MDTTTTQQLGMTIATVNYDVNGGEGRMMRVEEQGEDENGWCKAEKIHRSRKTGK